MGARITELVLRRETALSLLHRAGNDRFLLAAIAVLEDEPGPGQRGGPARQQNGLLSTPNRRRAAVKQAPELREDLGISRREREILEQLSLGLTNTQIGEALYLTEDTIKTYMQRLFRRFGVNNRTALLSVAVQREAA